MLKLNWCAFVGCLILTIITGSIASGQCAAGDGNDTRDDATPIGFNETVSGWVCPDDPFDYYVLEIPKGDDVTGKIMFYSPQESTVLRIWLAKTGERLVDDRFTTANVHEFTITVKPGRLAAGTYYARVFFWSAADYDHEYTFTTELNIGGQEGVTITDEPEPVESEGTAIPTTAVGTLFRESGAGDIPEIAPPPWPSPRADAMKTGRSQYDGPSGAAFKSAEFNIVDLVWPEAWFGYHVKGLLAGTRNRVYFMHRSDYAFTAYDLSTGLLWQYPVRNVYNPVSFDNLSSLYVVNDDKHRLVCLNFNGAEVWTANLPGDLFEKRLNEVWAVGRRVYVSKCMAGSMYVAAWERNGSRAWEAGPLASVVMGISEDPGNYVYVNTRNALYQYDWDGDNTWHAEFTSPGSELARGRHLGPIIGQDRRVYVNDPYNREFYIYNTDGTLYKQGVYSDYHTHYYNNDPKAACVGGDGRFYVASFTDVICFNDWTDEVWRKTIGSDKYVRDIIMGSDDTIYALYQTAKGERPGDAVYHWVSLRPGDGGIIFDMDIQVLEQFWAVADGELAIGQDNKLIYLNHAGYLAVFEPFGLHVPAVLPGHKTLGKSGGR